MIPSYAEGRDVEQTILSVARQLHFAPRNIAVVVVINNARDAVADVLESNAETAEVVEQLKSHMPPHIELRSVSMWQGEDAPEECNVGLARDAGVRAILPEMKSDGILINTDADTILASNHLQTALDRFEADPELAGLVGTVEVDTEEVSTRARVGMAMLAVKFRLKKLFELMYQMDVSGRINDRVPEYASGANMVMRADLYEKIGGFQHLSTGEDADLLFRIMSAGGKVEHSNLLRVLTSGRFSERTTFGLGRTIERTVSRHAISFSFDRVISRQAVFAANSMLDQMDGQRDLTDPVQWKAGLKETMDAQGIELTSKQLKSLWRVTRKVPAMIPTFHIEPRVARKVYEIIDTSIPTIPFVAAVADAANYLVESAEIPSRPLLVDHAVHGRNIKKQKAKQAAFIKGWVDMIEAGFCEAFENYDEETKDGAAPSDETLDKIDDVAGFVYGELKSAVEVRSGFSRLIAATKHLETVINRPCYQMNDLLYIKMQIAVLQSWINTIIIKSMQNARLPGGGGVNKNPFNLSEDPETMAAGYKLRVKGVGRMFFEEVMARPTAPHKNIRRAYLSRGMTPEIMKALKRLEEEVDNVLWQDRY